MARRRTLNRGDLRAQAEAAEAREKDTEEAEDEEVEEEADADADDDGGDDEDAPKKKKAKPKAAPKAKKPAAPRKTRAPKEVRMKAVWVVFDNGSKRLKEFPYPQKSDAEKFLAEKIEEKKGTFYISLIKEPLDG
ncbi:MAG: hypothetical protein U0871_20040 [Gemmataceae bacterium]